MRAMMSHKNRTLHEIITPQMMPGLALQEARRILAETEPGGYADYRTAHICVERLHGAGRADGRGATRDGWGGVVALAEALERFIGDAQ